MIFPSLAEVREALVVFAREEQLSWGLVFQPLRVIDIMLRHRFLHFLVVGGGGLAIGLGITWLFTTFIFGLEGYFTAYLIGTAAALIFNFTMYSLVIFRTSKEHVRRLAAYFVYILVIIIIQAQIVNFVTPLVGLKWYLLIIGSVIAVFSIINFLVFKLSIFKERNVA